MAVQFDSAPVSLVKGGAVPHAAARSDAAPGFGDALHAVLASVDTSAGEANTAVTGMLQGTGDVHDAMLALQRAQTTLELTIQVRNKLVGAYQDIMRMPCVALTFTVTFTFCLSLLTSPVPPLTFNRSLLACDRDVRPHHRADGDARAGVRGSRGARRRLGLLAEHPPYSVLSRTWIPKRPTVSSRGSRMTRCRYDRRGRADDRVPTARLDEVRLQVAGQGMPASVGSASRSSTAPTSARPISSSVNYRRALEASCAPSARSPKWRTRACTRWAGRRCSPAGIRRRVGGPQTQEQPAARAVDHHRHLRVVASGVACGPRASRSWTTGRPSRSTDSRDEVPAGWSPSATGIDAIDARRVAARADCRCVPRPRERQRQAEYRQPGRNRGAVGPESVMRSHQSVVQAGRCSRRAGVAGVRSNTPPPQPSTPREHRLPPVEPPAATSSRRRTPRRYQPQSKLTATGFSRRDRSPLSVAVLLGDDRTGVTKGKASRARRRNRADSRRGRRRGRLMERGDGFAGEMPSRSRSSTSRRRSRGIGVRLRRSSRPAASSRCC